MSWAEFFPQECEKNMCLYLKTHHDGTDYKICSTDLSISWSIQNVFASLPVSDTKLQQNQKVSHLW